MRGGVRWAFIEAFSQGLGALGLVMAQFIQSLDTARAAGDKSASYLMGALFMFLFGRAKRNEHDRLKSDGGH